MDEVQEALRTACGKLPRIPARRRADDAEKALTALTHWPTHWPELTRRCRRKTAELQPVDPEHEPNEDGWTCAKCGK